MKRNLVALLLAVIAVAPSIASALPRDVQRFIERREGCDHMRGEIPDTADLQSTQSVSAEIDRLCKGTDRELERLKRKYANYRRVIKRLDKFETRIESAERRN